MYFREVLRLSLAMLSYESIDTALNQLYILIYSFEFRISGIVKMNSNFQQLSVDEWSTFKNCIFKVVWDTCCDILPLSK